MIPTGTVVHVSDVLFAEIDPIPAFSLHLLRYGYRRRLLLMNQPRKTQRRAECEACYQ